MTPPYVAFNDEGIIEIADEGEFTSLDRFAVYWVTRVDKTTHVQEISEKEAERLRLRLANKPKKE